MPTYADQVSLNVFSPGIYMAIDSSLSKTGLPIFMQRTVMFGQMGTDAQATAGQVVQIVTENDAKAAFGVDSMLHGMVKVFRKRNPYQTLLVVPLAENVAGNAAAGGITIAGAATKPMTQYFYIGSNIPYQLGVSSGEAAADVAGRLVTLVNNDPAAKVVATNDGADVTLTCKWKGETGNDIFIATRYHDDDTSTPGLTFAVTAMTGGTGNPDITDGLDALDDLTQYQGFVNPFTDTVNRGILRSELDDRWGPLRAVDGRVFSCVRTGVATLVSHAATANDQNYIPIDIGEDAASPSWEAAAAFAAAVMYYGAIDPGRPFQTLELVDIAGARSGKRRLGAENETLLAGGVSTTVVGDDGKVRIHRAVTSYTENELGAEDEAYKSLNTVMLMSYYRRSVINRFQLRFPRHKLKLTGGSQSSFVMSPETGIAEFLAHYKTMVDNDLMDDFDGYKADILAAKNENKRGRLDVFDRPRPIDQFHQLAVRAAFKLV
ncbi:MAG: hypothetical protein CMM61_08165 [Rhodospirillaceae bacterium]|nr:hypothetical protein [Rhodospirillaceae bacterium]